MTGLMTEERMTGLPAAVALAVAIVLPLCTQFADAKPIELFPHRAVYDLKLDSSENSAGIGETSGRLVFELMGNSCDGYATNYRFLLQNRSDKGRLHTFDTRTSSFENARTGEFRFFHKFYENEKLIEESSGIADRDAIEFSVALDKPEETELKLSSGTLFPMEHTQKTISEALLGETFVSDEVYDGSEDGQTVYAVTTVIGDSSTIDSSESDYDSKILEALSGERHWPVTFSYFKKGESNSGEQTPDFQYYMDLYENGVTGDLKIKYSGYSLLGNISELEMLPREECES